jgi:hypothetical protein
LIHLRTHKDLANDTPTNDYLWLDAALEETGQVIVAALLPKIFERAAQKGILYGIHFDERDYFSPNGEYVRKKHTEGLTCATFVLAVFRRVGFELVEIDSWPVRPEEAQWHASIVNSNQAKFGPQRTKAQLGLAGEVRRFKVGEVAAAVAKYTHSSLTHPDLSEDGAKIEAQVEEFTPALAG